MESTSASVPRKEDEQEKNEDCIRIGENFAYIIDGTNGITDKSATEKATNGRWYVQELDKKLSKRIKNQDKKIKDVLSKIISELFDEFEKRVHKKEFELKNSETPSAFISIARWNDSELEVYSLGDCTAMIKKKDDLETFRNSKMIELEKQILQKIQSYKEKQGLTHEQAIEKIMPEYLEIKRKQDTPGGWYSIGFNPKTPEKGKTRKYNLENIEELILHTDGLDNLKALHNNIENPEQLYKYINQKGLKETIQKMRQLEEKDSECNKAPRYKKSDDTTIAKITEFNSTNSLDTSNSN